MLVSTPAKPIPDAVVDCIKAIYSDKGAKLMPSGAVGGLTKAQVWYAWSVVRLAPHAPLLMLPCSSGCLPCLVLACAATCLNCLRQSLMSCCACTADPSPCCLQMLWVLAGKKTMPLRGDKKYDEIKAPREAAVLGLRQSKQFDFSNT